jgi:TRAP-type C4-dicarboxylate transport system permease small subunit
MQIYNITIEPWLTGSALMAAVLMSFYWLRRAIQRYRGRLRYTKAQQEAIREKARRSL